MMFSSKRHISRQIGTMQPTLDIQALQSYSCCHSITQILQKHHMWSPYVWQIYSILLTDYPALAWAEDHNYTWSQTRFSCSRDWWHPIAYHTLSWITSNQKVGSVFLGAIKVCKPCERSVSYHCGYFCSENAQRLQLQFGSLTQTHSCLETLWEENVNPLGYFFPHSLSAPYEKMEQHVVINSYSITMSIFLVWPGDFHILGCFQAPVRQE